MQIRTARKHDLHSIIAIYNQAVAMGFMTADTEPWIPEEKQVWFDGHTEHEYPVYVVENAGQIVGWLSVSAYRPGRRALRTAKEVSYYVDKHHKGQGVGSALLQHAITEAANLGVKNYIAILLDVNEPSRRLLEKHGFKQWGHLPAIADFTGQVCGHLYYGLAI